MNGIIPDIDRELDIIFGEFRDPQVVQSFVRGAREAGLTGTLYVGYPVLAIDDGRVEFDAVLVSRDRGVIIFDIYSFAGRTHSASSGSAASDVDIRQEQLYAALYNKLNSFKELRRGRQLLVDIITVAIDPLKDVRVWDQDAETHVVGLNSLSIIPQLAPSDRISDVEVQHLNAAIQRISNLRPPKKRDNVTRPNSKGAAIKAIEAQIANLDLWQKRGSIEYVDGPQRIRGLAGSGKTVVLALKAAYLHVKRPDWKIVVTFNTRSLYQQFESLIQRFVFAQIGDSPDWEKLIVMHAWGAFDRPGVYSTMASLLGIPFRDFGAASRMFGYNQAFDGACNEVVSNINDRDLDLYDVMLIDEAQDLPASFFRIAYRAVKDPRRIVWAYDDLQNLGDFHMPSEAELFGWHSDGTQRVTLLNSEDQPQQDIVLPRSYRNPPWTLVTAHGLGFGINHDPMIQMFPDPALWLRLGYREIQGELDFDRDVIIERDPKSVPDFFGKLLNPEDSLQVRTAESQDAQYDIVAKTIAQLLADEELQHSDILIVMPDTLTSRRTGARILTALRENGLQGHVPGVTSSRDEVFKDSSIAVTHIHRAKGNEAPVIFVVDADFCESPFDKKKRRNVLFTAITRSRAWTYVIGVGPAMQQIEKEILQIRQNNYRLAFHYPTQLQAAALAASSDLPRPGISVGREAVDDLRVALKKAKKEQLLWDDLPDDLQRDFQEIYGPGK
ncbi:MULTISPECIES: DEAD/DEAH box helicase [unclassified Bradyrhizobium]|uniref:DEAD/DEAH box helicase n=1 Tax=unclassified Bradyrhizobium TaxID=2631580 RepID=UPI0028EAA8CF|nr:MULTISPECIES: ATP-binding domain-containing protein [unclassified Bradyrhizobium]